MKIVCTDISTVTNGDIDLDVLKEFGEVVFYDNTRTEEETIARIGNCDIVLINKTVLNAKVLSHAKNLKYIGLFATGYNVVDIDYCRTHKITVCNAGSYSTAAVAQTVFAFLLNHYSRVADYTSFVRQGGWIQSPTFTSFVLPTMELAGKTIGIVGYGSIGRYVANIANAFGMRVLATNRSPKTDTGVTFVDFDTLLAQSDVVTVHCPLNRDSEKMFNKATFAKMKDGAYFINTARGGVLVENDLRDALEQEKLSGAAVDVLDKEPMLTDCPLFGAKNLTVTPHVAWAPLQTRERLVKIVVQNLQSYLNGEPENVIV